MPVSGRVLGPSMLAEVLVKEALLSSAPVGRNSLTVPLKPASEGSTEMRCPAVPSTSRRPKVAGEPIVSVFEEFKETRPVALTLEGEPPRGGMNRSGPAADPLGVTTEVFPPSRAGGTLRSIEEALADVSAGCRPLKATTLSIVDGSKFEPAIVTSSPAAAIVGSSEDMLGFAEAATVKLWALVTGPSPGV